MKKKIVKLKIGHLAEEGQLFFDDAGNVFRYLSIVDFKNYRKAEVVLVNWMRVTKETLTFKQESLFLSNGKPNKSEQKPSPVGGGSFTSTPQEIFCELDEPFDNSWSRMLNTRKGQKAKKKRGQI